MDESVTLEGALESVERSVGEVTDAAAKLVAAGKKARKAAVFGDLKLLRQSLEDIVDLADHAGEAAVRAEATWPFKTETDEEAYFADGRYQAELVDAAGRAQLGLYDMEGVLAAFPSLVRIVARNRTVEIDRKPFRPVRPSYLIDHLRKVQAKPGRTNVTQLVDALHKGYKLTIAEKSFRGGVARLLDVYRNLTILPSARKDYTLQEFARDIYLLDESGIAETSAGSRLRLHPGATGSKSPGQLLRVIDRDGAEKTYYGIEFGEGTR